jgi:hypothetical protein
MKTSKNRKYFRDALASVSERFSSFSGDELGGLGGFAGAGFAGQDLNAAGVNIHQYNAKTSSPYEVLVQNTTGGALTAVIFGSDNNRTAANFGNPVGITITSATPNINYLQQLASSEIGSSNNFSACPNDDFSKGTCGDRKCWPESRHETLRQTSQPSKRKRQASTMLPAFFNKNIMNKIS